MATVEFPIPAGSLPPAPAEDGICSCGAPGVILHGTKMLCGWCFGVASSWRRAEPSSRVAPEGDLRELVRAVETAIRSLSRDIDEIRRTLDHDAAPAIPSDRES